MNENSPKKVLIICEGNIGRSQMGEGFFNHYSKDGAISAGITDVGAKYDYKPRADIVSAMKEKGIDISDQRVKQITKEMLADIKTILVLCKPDLLPNFVKSSAIKIIFREVADPYESSMDGLRQIRDQIEEIILDLIGS